jgi:branched-chain amino acid transport system permease protein
MRKWVPWGAALLALVAAPNVLSAYHVNVLTLGLLAGALGMSLNLLVTYAGMPSLAHAAFFGVGAYTAGLLAVKAGMSNVWVALATGAGVAAALGAVFGVVALRTRDVYFLIITLSLAAMLWGLAVKWRPLTGGDDGLVGIPVPSLDPLPVADMPVTNAFALAAGCLVLVGLVVQTVRRSSYGHVLVGIRDSESRMAALGYRTWWYRFSAFVLSGVLAALPGVLTAFQLQFVSPAEMNILVSIEALLFVVLGAATLWGPAFAGVAFIVVDEAVGNATEHHLLVLGVLYVVASLVEPRRVIKRLQAVRPRAAQPIVPAAVKAAPVREVGGANH